MTCNRIFFRTAEISDILTIKTLARNIWLEHYPGIISHEQIEYMLGKMYAEDVIADEMANKNYRYVLVETNNAAVGYISYQLKNNEKAVLLSKLYLLSRMHGRGIGKLMLEHVKGEAHKCGAKMIFLFVNKKNIKAIKAYERFGFVKTEEVTKDIGSGFVMDDFRMELQIN